MRLMNLRPTAGCNVKAWVSRVRSSLLQGPKPNQPNAPALPLHIANPPPLTAHCTPQRPADGTHHHQDEHRKHSDGVRKRLQAAAAAKRSFLDISGGSGDKKRKGGRGKGGRSKAKGRGGRGDEASEEERRNRLYHQDGGSSAAGSNVASLGYAEPEGYGRANEDSGEYQDVEAAGGMAAGGATADGRGGSGGRGDGRRAPLESARS